MLGKAQSMTKEQEEEMWNEMIEKNERIKKRHQEVLADKMSAEQCDSSVTNTFSKNIKSELEISKSLSKDEEWRSERREIDEQRVARNSSNCPREWDEGKTEKGFGIEDDQNGEKKAYKGNLMKDNFSYGRRRGNSRQYEQKDYYKDRKMGPKSFQQQRSHSENEMKKHFGTHDHESLNLKNDNKLIEIQGKQLNYANRSSNRNDTVNTFQRSGQIPGMATNTSGFNSRGFYRGRGRSNVFKNFDYHGRGYSNRFKEQELLNDSTFLGMERKEKSDYIIHDSKHCVSTYTNKSRQKNPGRNFQSCNFEEEKTFRPPRKQVSATWSDEDQEDKEKHLQFSDSTHYRKPKSSSWSSDKKQTSATWSDEEQEDMSLFHRQHHSKSINPPQSRKIPSTWRSDDQKDTSLPQNERTIMSTDLAHDEKKSSGTGSDKDQEVKEKHLQSSDSTHYRKPKSSSWSSDKKQTSATWSDEDQEDMSLFHRQHHSKSIDPPKYRKIPSTWRSDDQKDTSLPQNEKTTMSTDFAHDEKKSSSTGFDKDHEDKEKYLQSSDSTHYRKPKSNSCSSDKKQTSASWSDEDQEDMSLCHRQHHSKSIDPPQSRIIPSTWRSDDQKDTSFPQNEKTTMSSDLAHDKKETFGTGSDVDQENMPCSSNEKDSKYFDLTYDKEPKSDILFDEQVSMLIPWNEPSDDRKNPFPGLLSIDDTSLTSQTSDVSEQLAFKMERIDNKNLLFNEEKSNENSHIEGNNSTVTKSDQSSSKVSEILTKTPYDHSDCEYEELD